MAISSGPVQFCAYWTLHSTVAMCENKVHKNGVMTSPLGKGVEIWRSGECPVDKTF